MRQQIFVGWIGPSLTPPDADYDVAILFSFTKESIRTHKFQCFRGVGGTVVPSFQMAIAHRLCPPYARNRCGLAQTLFTRAQNSFVPRALMAPNAPGCIRVEGASDAEAARSQTTRQC